MCWRRSKARWRAPNPRGDLLARQLANPLCAEQDWKLLTLEAAQTTGRPIASGNESKPDKILVNFPELCAFVAGERPRSSHFALGLPAIASLVLLLGAVISLIFGLTKLHYVGAPPPVPALSQA